MSRIQIEQLNPHKREPPEYHSAAPLNRLALNQGDTANGDREQTGYGAITLETAAHLCRLAESEGRSAVQRGLRHEPRITRPPGAAGHSAPHATNRRKKSKHT
jgi:hypothetical protein